jgi:sec-independent protein translocase protein TatA
MLDGLEGWHIVLIVVVAALLFGSGKLPGAARSVGQSLRIFKSEMKAAGQDDATPAPVPASGESQAVAPPQVVGGTVVTHTVADPVPQNVPTQQ